MKKIIGGLLVISLLSRPTVIQINFIAYEIFKSQQKAAIIAEHKKDNVKEEKKRNPTNVENMINDISDNSKNISFLMRKKEEVIEQIKTAMDFKALTKNPMTDDQIKSFIQFNEFYNKEVGALRETLNRIDTMKDLTLVKREIMQMETDFEIVSKGLGEITYYQDSAINCLNSIIDHGEKTLVLI